MAMRMAMAVWLCAGVATAQTGVQELVDGGHWKRARAIVEAKYKESPNDAETVYWMARVKHVWGKMDEAEKLAEKAVTLNPKEARYRFALAEALGDQAEHAGTFHQIGLARKFKKEVDAAIQLDPRHTGALTDLMMFYYKAPGIVGGDKAKARETADQIARIDPVLGAFAHVILAREEKQEAQVEALYRKAVEARPQSYEAQMSLASYLTGHKNFEEAERHAREAIRLYPDRAGAYGWVAVLMVQQDKWSELDALLAQSEKAAGDNLAPFFRAANNCLARKVELPRAERYLRKYLTQEPEPGAATPAQAHWRLGLVLEQMGRKPDAVAELEAALKLDPASGAKADLKRLK